MAICVEEVSASLVREYLSRKGLKRTIACMDDERPRTQSSINNRSHLRQVLHIEDLYRANKVHNSPLRTLLEIIVKYHIEGHKDDNMACKSDENDSLQSAFVISSLRLSPAKTPSEINESDSGHSTLSFVSGDRLKLRSQDKEFSTSQMAVLSLDGERLMDHSETRSWLYTSVDENGHSKMTSMHDNGCLAEKPEKKPPVNELIQRRQPNRVRRGMMAGPIASTLQESTKQRQSRKVGTPQMLFRKEEEEHRQSRDELSGNSLQQKVLEKSPSSAIEKLKNLEKEGQGRNDRKIIESKMQPNMILSEMVLDDIDDELPEISKMSFENTATAGSSHTARPMDQHTARPMDQHTARPMDQHTVRPMDQHTASELKLVLLGSSLKCFTAEWRNQGFTFSETHDLRYGMVQKKAGPCGVLASIQAFVLKKLLFENKNSSNARLQRLRPTNATRRKCLVLAVAEVLWRAGEEKQATVAINTGRTLFTSSRHYKSEGVLEKISCFTVDSIKDLQLLLEQHIEQFETGELGCLLLTISAVLSRSIDKMREDMDVAATALIGAHGYCTQELVNLLLVGRAVSNVFDGDVELDSGNGKSTLLMGIKAHCNIGLLSLFEHYNVFKVGDYLKNPLFPIWVVCSESHFSVLFGLQGELSTNPDKGLEFDLYYYDGLANQQEEIRLTVSLGKSTVSCQNVNADLIPPLELCIRTRWKDAFGRGRPGTYLS
ncbi:probable ubiquitin carboxyl-terminal hydrolase MINDY-4 isoform X2 [Phyllopteryx taeniolatus]|uniref:probable ubiquitin carboxyl-terminal hydrolase MINDY-4 isoform X2 n=1 Tax=Phyllopteryx taeniolatus TaxID=161469 RepID=UPI002AD34F22|nr:probable ubiquitin carboxyl-terminal hydrolase MINDY-4 isoform X2 [Phyllopteryx taeniolatus]